MKPDARITNPAAHGILRRHPLRRRDGSALLLSLWALLMLSAAVLAWVRFIDAEISLSNQANRGLEARALAHSGLAVGLKAKRGSPLLRLEEGTDRGYRVKKTGEGGKLHINTLLIATLRNRNSTEALILRQYFGSLGLNFREQDVLIDCLLDWIDPDSNRQMNGKEATANYRPPNRGYLTSIDEIAQVHGAEPLLEIPGWQEGLTIHGDGKIDVLAADLDILMLIPGVSERAAITFLSIRRGPDGEDGTPDDFEFKSGIAEVKQYLGLPQGNDSGVLAFGSTLWRIESVGQVGNIQRVVEVVAQLGENPGSQPATIFSWIEK